MNRLFDLYSDAYAKQFEEEGTLSFVVAGAIYDYGYNVMSNGRDHVEVQFDIPESHFLYGLNMDDAGESAPITEVITVHDADGNTTWARWIFNPSTDPYITEAETESERCKRLWCKVMMAALEIGLWLELSF